MKKRTWRPFLLLALGLSAAAAQTAPLQLPPIADGPFKPDWNSLTNYQTPEWFRDAKFGIWAHWGAQCQPEHGDWYARSMYETGSRNYKSHLIEYGHPSTNGFKDVIRVWKAEHFDPDQLLKFSNNGNLMLNVPLRGDGQPDSDEIAIINEIGAWMKVNGKAIYATRPWKERPFGGGRQTEGHPRCRGIAGFPAGEVRSQDRFGSRDSILKTHTLSVCAQSICIERTS
jgi:hypothetical protein